MNVPISIEDLIDIGIEENLVPNKRFLEEWSYQNNWQLDALKTIGLEPKHHLLDVGCGPLRLGLSAIPYLDDEHYFGIDAFEPYVNMGKKVLAKAGIIKAYQLAVSSTFQFDQFQTAFDFAIAQSVFTHLSREQIEQCMQELKLVMQPGGQLIFTYIEQRKVPRGFLYYGVVPMIYPDHCDENFLKELANQNKVTFSKPDIQHKSQSVGLFTF